MPVLTKATKERQRLERLKRMTLQERMLADHNKRLKRERNKQTFSAQDAEKTAEKIVDTPKEGFLDDFIDPAGDVSEFYDTLKEGVTNIGSDIKQWWEKDDVGSAAHNLKRIQEEHLAGGGTGYADQTFPPPPPPSAQAMPGEFPQSEDDAREDFTAKMEAHRERQAAQKNNVTNKRLLEMRKKRREKILGVKKLPFAGHVEKVQGIVEGGQNVDALGEEIIPDQASQAATFEDTRDLREQGDIFAQDPRSYDEEPMQGDGFEQAPSDYDYDTAVPPPPETVVTPTETAMPKHVPHGRPESYDYDKEAYEGIDQEIAQGNIPQSEAEAKGGPEGLFNLGEAGKDPEWSQEDDLEGQNVVKEQSSELNKTILEGTPKEVEVAKEVRKKIYAHLPPRERALAKEETGNYWIDPISGVAINIDAIEADGKRKSNWLMIDKLPEHARPYFMAKFGYLDEEDVDGMPIDPKLVIAEMNVQAKKLELESLEKRHTQSTDVQYAQITGKSELQAANLKWDREKYNNLSKAQQEELQIKQYDQVRSNVDMLFKNGQYEAGMLLGQGLGIPYVMDMKGFWKSKAKTTDIDPMFGMALRGSGLEGLTKKAAGTAYYKAIGDYWKDLITPSTDPEMKSSYFQETAKKNGHRLWNDLSDAERKIARNPMLHHNSIRSKLLTELMGKDPRFGTLHTNLNNARAQRNLGDRGDGTGTDTGKKKKTSEKLDKTSTKITKKVPKLSEKSPVEELKDMDTKYEFGSEKYTAELAGGLLGLGKWDYDQYGSFMEYRNSAEGLREITKKNLGPEKIKRKLAEAYKTGKKGFEEILAKQKKSDTPKFTSIEEAAVYYNKKAGAFGDKRHYVRNDVKYYISRNLK